MKISVSQQTSQRSESHFSAQDEQFMRQALKQAHLAQKNGEVPIGAVLVKDEQIIAEGMNGSITLNDPTAHAEIQALRQGAQALENYRLLNTTLYVTLEPCPMCVGALLHARVERIVFGAYDKKTGSAGSVEDLFTSPAAFHKAQVQGGLLADECKMLLQSFFKKRRAEHKKAKHNIKDKG